MTTFLRSTKASATNNERVRSLVPYVIYAGVLAIAWSMATSDTYWQNIALQWTLFATMAVAFNIVAGFAGRLAFGNTVFFGVSAYTIVAGDVHGWYPPLVGAFLAVGICAVLAFILSYAFWRLTGLMFALATFALALIFQQVATITDVFGKSTGLQEELRFENSIKNLSFADQNSFVLVGFGILTLAILVGHLIARSDWGLTLKAGRDDPIAAKTAGINVPRNAALAWSISAALTAIAGVFYAQFNLFVEPVSSYGLLTVNSIAIPAIVGGLGYVWGPVIGSALVPVGLYLNNLSTGSDGLIGANNLLYGVVLVVVLRLLPGGIASLRDLDFVVRHLPLLASRKAETGSRAIRIDADESAEDPLEAESRAVLDEAAEAPTILRVADVEKHFGGLPALKNVTLDIKQGEILGLVGPNGAGKSTLFNCITGVEKPDAGTVELQGESISGAPAYRVFKRGIARTYQIPKLFDHLTALENVASAAIGVVDDPWGQARQALNDAGLSDQAEIRAAKLTLIERRMVELARAVVVRPKVVLLDEVMTGLEESEAAHVQNLIRRLHASGITFVIVEHVMGYLLPLTHRVAVLHRGVILASGTPNQVLRHPEVLEAYFGRVDEDGQAPHIQHTETDDPREIEHADR